MEEFELKFAIITGIIGVVLGIIGTVLGVLNTIYAWSRDKVKVRVDSGITVNQSDEKDFGFVVVNLSRFPITLREIGFLIRGYKGNRLMLVRTMVHHQFPYRMEPRTSFAGKLFLGEDDKEYIPSIKGIYVFTECGSKFSSKKDPILKEFIRQYSPSK